MSDSGEEVFLMQSCLIRIIIKIIMIMIMIMIIVILIPVIILMMMMMMMYSLYSTKLLLLFLFGHAQMYNNYTSHASYFFQCIVTYKL